MESEGSSLPRELTTLNVFSVVFGSIIGWGVFTLTPVWLSSSGPWGVAIAAYLSVLLLLPIALSYNFMTVKHPRVGGEFEWAYVFLGRSSAFFVGWWLLLSYTSIIALNATAFPLWLKVFIPNAVDYIPIYIVGEYTVSLGWLVASSTLVIVFTVINGFGVRISGMAQTLVTFILISTGLFFITTSFLLGDVRNSWNPSPWSLNSTPVLSVFRWVAIAPWAFLGFNSIPQVIEEYRGKPAESVKALLTGLLVGATFYAFITVASTLSTPWDALTKVDLPTIYTAEKLTGQVGVVLLSAGALAGICSGINGFFLMSSRLAYAMALRKLLPESFSEINPQYRVPRKAILAVGLAALTATFLGRALLTRFVRIASFGVVIAYLFTGLTHLKTSETKLEKLISVATLANALFFLMLLTTLALELYEKVGITVYFIASLITYGIVKLKERKKRIYT
ncbi:MAG: hypothetical protein B7O98_06570 [Zestosphaera tikiterensis]|uniref:Amino acid permease n=1 Tax=Zestosphaera tikiterensis TaxID=1973259 RepID=A0A2R7Y4L0_9CREN|nr:MAG: hypothetical protein B7O98_06570 [Zestosphaera tikiterensis]